MALEDQSEESSEMSPVPEKKMKKKNSSVSLTPHQIQNQINSIIKPIKNVKFNYGPPYIIQEEELSCYSSSLENSLSDDDDDSDDEEQSPAPKSFAELEMVEDSLKKLNEDNLGFRR